MKDEIKEILEILKEDLYIPQEDNREYKLLDKGDDKLLLDYITNLQEENEKLKEDIEDISVSHFSLFKQYEDYKSRNEKAMEYIKTHEYPSPYGFRKNNISKKDLLNILNGDDKNE